MCSQVIHNTIDSKIRQQMPYILKNNYKLKNPQESKTVQK